MTRNLTLILLLVTHSWMLGDCHNLLVVTPVWGGSHLMGLLKFSQHLVQNRGHNVTLIAFEGNGITKNCQYHHPNLKILELKIRQDYGFGFCKEIFDDNGSIDPHFRMRKRLWEHGEIYKPGLESIMDQICLRMGPSQSWIDNRDVRNHLQTGDFDAALLDFSGNPLAFAIAKSLKLPTVTLHVTDYSGPERDLLVRGKPWSTIHGFLIDLILSGLAIWPYFYQQIGLPWCSTLQSEAEVHLVNTEDFLASEEDPHPSNVVMVGGLHFGKPGVLNEDISQFMKGYEAKGVILFTLGSAKSVEILPNSVKLAFFEAFRRLDVGVIMKYDPKMAPKFDDAPAENIYMATWIPQFDILADNRTILFLSHCGSHGAQEAIFHGVPVAAFPIGDDQFDNSDRLVRNGLAMRLPGKRDNISADSVFEVIDQLLRNDSIKANVMNVSEQLKARPTTGLGEATYWVEHVMRRGQRLKRLKSIPNNQSHFGIQMIWASILAYTVYTLNLIMKKSQ